MWNAKHRQNPLLFAQRVNSNLNPGKREGEKYEKEIEKNFSSRIGSYINMEYMRMAATKMFLPCVRKGRLFRRWKKLLKRDL